MTGQDYGRTQSCSGALPLISSPSSYPLASLPTAGVDSAEEKGEKSKKRRQRGGDRPGEVLGQNHRRGTDLQLWVLSCLELEGTLWLLAFKCF